LKSPRPARREDAAALAELDRRASAAGWTRGQWEAEFGKTFARVWVGEEEGSPAAFIVLWALGDEAQVANLGVDPLHRRRGWGRLLGEHALRAAREEGARRATLEVRASGGPARALYAALGFRETSRRKNYYGGNEAALLMEKEL
jgi:ribosomal-protein-alanine N-acetyltransferase